MKRGNYLSYEFFEKIDHDSSLAFFLNKVFESMHLARLVSAPRVFESNDPSVEKKQKDREYEIFYQTCLFELYAHSLVRKIEYWQEKVKEYLCDYNGSWEYYARSKRLHSIEEYGGNESDYNDDDSIKTDVGIGELKSYSIIQDMVSDDWTDIVTQTKVEDLNPIYLSIQVDGSFSLRDMFKSIGAGDLKSYRQEGGVMVENSEDDETLYKISSQSKSEDLTQLLVLIVYMVNDIVQGIVSLQHDCDNKEYFTKLLDRLHNLLGLNFQDEIKNFAANKKV